jgi:DTW domain-containing protein YfiP
MLPPAGPATQYQLRHEPKEGGLATFEAMARALGFIEDKMIEEKMTELFLLMVKRTLLTRRGILKD